MSQDPQARRPTPLALQLAGEIAEHGPISVEAYMQRCLTDPQHGYYTNRAAIGAGADFTTAPEISQIFGELIGLWLAVVWQQMGAPGRVSLIELGPGRGTLISDALRAARLVPDFLAAVELHLVEINPELRELQARALAASGIEATWHADWPEPNGLPTLVLGNEFLDTIPARQWRREEAGDWREVMVGCDAAGSLKFTERQSGPPPVQPADAAAGPGDKILALADFGALADALAVRVAQSPLAGLFIDYGHPETAYGDTLQAVRDHAYEHVLASPGEADLSVSVDFGAVGRALAGRGIATDGPQPQAVFLEALGLAERAARLMAESPERAHEIEVGAKRLTAPGGMGTRFLCLGVRSPELAPLPGFG